MEFVQYQTGTDDEGRRLDKVLRILFPDTPLSYFYSCLRKGLIRVNQKKVKQDYHISCGDIIFVAEFLDFSVKNGEKKRSGKTEIEIQCIFKNDDLVFLNKPFDMPVHETKSYSGTTLNEYVLEHFPADHGSLSFTPGPLHRLDRKTTGIIAFSQSIQGARIFTDLLKLHKIKKHYLSIVEGKLDKEVTFTDLLLKDETKAEESFHTMKVLNDEHDTSACIDCHGNAKKAITIVKPVATGYFHEKSITLVEVNIETGRMHQIRSQCAAHGYPLVGDSAYGSTIKETPFLHAYRLEMPVPNALGLPKELYAPMPERFLKFVENYLSFADLSPYNKTI